jgi:hypothetical protein
MKIISLLILAMASCTQVLANEARIKLLSTKKEQKVGSLRTTTRDHKSELYRKLIESNKEIKRLLMQKSSEPVIWDGKKSILTGKVFKGLLLNSIVSTNLGSPVLVRASEGQGLSSGTLFSCTGATKNRRVITICNKMITKTKEVSITAQILNLDGSAGLLGEYDDGKDELIAGAIISDMAQGVLSVAQNKVATPFGAYTDSTVKNQALGGLISGAQTSSEILLDEMKNKEPIVTINAGTEVLIYFMEALHEY